MPSHYGHSNENVQSFSDCIRVFSTRVRHGRHACIATWRDPRWRLTCRPRPFRDMAIESQCTFVMGGAAMSLSRVMSAFVGAWRAHAERPLFTPTLASANAYATKRAGLVKSPLELRIEGTFATNNAGGLATHRCRTHTFPSCTDLVFD